MRAVQIPRTDGPSAAEIVDLPTPEPTGDQLLIKVAAAGLNYADVAQSQGMYPGGPKAPYIAGLEAAGTVVAAGPDSPVPVGTRVMGMGAGALSEYVCWRTNQVFPTPDPWTDTQAAAFPVQWLTAHACLRTVGRVESGDNVLIHAAAGGVGQAAVRLARHFGAFVIGTAGSPEKCERVLAAGAHAAIDYRAQDFVAETLRVTEGDGIDLLLEMVGGETFRKNLAVLRPFGRMVVYGAASNEQANIHNVQLIFKPVEIIGYHLTVMMVKRPDLFARQWTEVVSLIAQGVIVPEEPETLPLKQAATALQRMANRQTTGKVVLTP
ncbi:MAG: NADPH:quinone oxidoreductase family protein [Deltaproteobacteria bacterium]|nr:MAG: NADPH:quinone oxidoreductase family protein [Deltaproteobacteria bacterium]